MHILVTIGSGVWGEAGIEFPTFPLTYAVALKTLWHECDEEDGTVVFFRRCDNGRTLPSHLLHYLGHLPLSQRDKIMQPHGQCISQVDSFS